MGNPFEDLRQAVVVRPMNSPGPQGAAAPELKIQYSNDGLSWHNDPIETDRYLRFSTDNGVSWSGAIYFNNLAETLEWVEKARQWAENPENDPVEDLQYSALHHALQAKKSEITAGEYAIDAAGSAAEAFGAAAPAWDNTIIYNYNDVVSFDNGHTYRCIGENIIGADHAPNINGVDNEEDWTRITVSPDGYFEIDEDGNLMPMLVPITSEIFMLDDNGDITYQPDFLPSYIKIQYSQDGITWYDNPSNTDIYIRFSTDNGMSWDDPIRYTNFSEMVRYVEKARQWAENPENYEVEPGQYSALHHALKAAISEFNAETAALNAAGSAAEAFGAAAPAWDSETVYNYNDVVSFDNGHTYRCIGTNIVGADHAPNINGTDNEAEWTRITVAPDGYFEVDENSDLMPMITPITSEIFMLDENGDIMYQEDIDLEPVPSDYDYSKIEFVNSISDLRNSQISSIKDYVYVVGYYGAGTPGGGLFYRDTTSTEADNNGTIIVDGNGVRWKRANVHEEYYASWFGVSTDISDNSPLIQNALNVIPSGSILIFGPGEYRCQQTIIIPDNPDMQNQLKYLTLQGSAKLAGGELNRTRLRYSGPNPSTLIPLIDFRGSTGNKRFIGSIRNIMFFGPGSTSNVVGLWFYDCVGSLFESILCKSFKYGIQIDYSYYYSKFNNVWCTYCDYGFRAIGTAALGNGAVFNYCIFSSSNVGFACNASSYWDTGIYLNNCYLEGNKTAIDAMVESSLHINGCYFERNSEYVLKVSCPAAGYNPIVEFNNTYVQLNGTDLSSHKAVIKQTANSGSIVSYDIRNNSIRNTSQSIPIIYYDYFIYVESGGIVIKAENNKLREPSASFPICSTTPSDSSYFNNHFSS